jgi:hypothetical protein
MNAIAGGAKFLIEVFILFFGPLPAPTQID